MDILALEEMLKQYNHLELQLVDFINKENAQFVETEGMKILQAYADTSRTLIKSLSNEILNPYKKDLRHVTVQDILTHVSSPEMFLASLKFKLNIKHGANTGKTLRDFSKNIDKLIEL